MCSLLFYKIILLDFFNISCSCSPLYTCVQVFILTDIHMKPLYVTFVDWGGGVLLVSAVLQTSSVMEVYGVNTPAFPRGLDVFREARC